MSTDAVHFDRLMGALEGLPDVTKTRPTTVRALTPLTGMAQTFIVQTWRQKDQGDTIFIEYIDATGSVRLAIPPAASKVISQQRDSINNTNRRKGARQAVQTRAERGIEPGFLKNPGRGGRRKKAKGARKNR